MPLFSPEEVCNILKLSQHVKDALALWERFGQPFQGFGQPIGFSGLPEVTISI